MKYMGSKARIAKEILPIILAKRKPDQWYVEPFCGGCNLIDKVPQGAGRLANDIHQPLISLLKAIQEGWLPPTEVSEEEYQAAKLLEDSNPLKGFIGFCSSYSGKYFGGYARGNTASGFPRNYTKEAFDNLSKQKAGLQGIRFSNYHYQDLPITRSSVIYCGPPYKGTTGYKNAFNHEEFYSWCRQMRTLGHTVFVSEYAMPEDFICLWSKKQTSSLTKDTGSKTAIERLYYLPTA